MKNSLPSQTSGNTNGMFPLVWDGKEFFIYSTLVGTTHYLDGFAIAESGQEPIVTVENTTTSTNGFQSQWLNAEVDADGVTIYEYFPGNDYGHFTVWRLTKDETPVGLRGDVNNDEAVTIADVSALIDYLLTEDATGVNLTNADCNLDEDVTIADVSALIDYLLTEVW